MLHYYALREVTCLSDLLFLHSSNEHLEITTTMSRQALRCNVARAMQH